MSQAVLRQMTAMEFLDWQAGQDALYELIDGAPVGTVGARIGHDMMVVNAVRDIASQLRQTSCRAFTEAVAIRIPAGNVRRPDVSVACGPFDPAATAAHEPRLIIEVLSPSTRILDQFRKLDEYKTIDSLHYILLADPEIYEVILWHRNAARDWQPVTLAGLEAAIDLPLLGLTLRLADLYEGLTVRPAPRLVRGEA